MRTRSVDVDQAGRLFYDGRQVSIETLKTQVETLPRDAHFLIRADKRVPLQYFVDVLGTVKGMGFRRVSRMRGFESEWLGQGAQGIAPGMGWYLPVYALHLTGRHDRYYFRRFHAGRVRGYAGDRTGPALCP
jgi:hypothetical protein